MWVGEADMPSTPPGWLLFGCRHVLIELISILHILLGLLEEFLGTLGEDPRQAGLAYLAHDEFPEIPLGFLGIEDKGILSFRLEHRIVAIE